MSKIKNILSIAALALLAPLSQAAGLIVNGGFESSDFVGAFSTIGTGNGLAGWTIESGSVDLINAYWQPNSGSYSIDLNGEGPATIAQSFDTTIGQTYVVNFMVAANTDGGGDKIFTAGINGGTNEFSVAIGGNSHESMGWSAQSFSFVADSTTSTLRFSGNADNTYYGAALDDISVNAVPEPETYGMLLAGLGLLGFAARRKQA